MAYSGDFGTFARKLERVQHDLSDDGFREQLQRVGRKLADEVDAAVRRTAVKDGSLFDQSMSGWQRGKPIELGGRSNVLDDGQIEIEPAAKSGAWRKGLGPMRVLESGRKAYLAGDRRKSGTRVRKKDGQRVDKYRKVKRNVGETTGKGTWSDAESKIYDKATPMLHNEELRVMARWFG